ncbi:amidohydrolase family protein [Mesorhizobium sp. VNQ89]|uniref:amidohydrolase family protein n=1 Tax=Mesorhizobium quangtriensis TaxID=3157709 RepID=UPI0032B74174
MTDFEKGDANALADIVVSGACIDGSAGEIVDIIVAKGVITAIGPGAAANVTATSRFDAQGGLVLSPFAEPHTHPDKVYSHENIARLGLPSDGPRPVLMQRQRDLKARFTHADVMDRASRFMHALAIEGVGLVAGQADIDSVTSLISVEGVLAAREACEEIIELVVTAFPQEGLIGDPQAYDLVAAALSMGADRVGGWPNNEPDEDARLAHLRQVFELAEKFGVGIDINIDYFTDPSERLLEPLAEMTVAHGMQGLVNANHVGALETYSNEDAARVIEKVAAAGISVTVCPTNLQGSYPWRGVSRPNQLLDAGINVAIGTGNHQDNWDLLSVLDPLERARFGWHALPLAGREGEGIDEAWRMVTTSARAAIGRPAMQLAPGAEASFVVLSAAERLHALRNEPASRLTVRHGKVVASRSVVIERHY